MPNEFLVAREAPLDVCRVTLDLLTALQPHCHLRELVLMVRRAVRILCEVDMEALGVLCVVIVCRAE